MVASGSKPIKNHGGKRGVVLSFLLCLLISPAWGSDIPEYKLKSAYLYNFASFTLWPLEYETFQLCIFGDDPFGRHLKQITSRKVKRRPIAARTVRTVENIDGCQMVFVAPSAINRINQITSRIGDDPVLIVADSPGALDGGAMINMETHRGKVRFDVNLKIVTARGLKISSKLLRLAREVQR